MNLKTEYIVFGVLAIIGVFAFNLFKNGIIDPNNPKNALQKVKEKYGTKIADWVERIYRLETNHFTSKQYKGTFSAGMEAHTNTYPYGWSTPHELWKTFPQYKPVAVINFRENATGKLKPFIAFNNLEAGMMSLAHFLAKYENPGRWYSTLKNHQDEYIDKLSKINTEWT